MKKIELTFFLQPIIVCAFWIPKEEFGAERWEGGLWFRDHFKWWKITCTIWQSNRPITMQWIKWIRVFTTGACYLSAPNTHFRKLFFHICTKLVTQEKSSRKINFRKQKIQ